MSRFSTAADRALSLSGRFSVTTTTRPSLRTSTKSSVALAAQSSRDPPTPSAQFVAALTPRVRGSLRRVVGAACHPWPVMVAMRWLALLTVAHAATGCQLDSPKRATSAKNHESAITPRTRNLRNSANHYVPR